jgi:hypothetical protein
MADRLEENECFEFFKKNKDELFGLAVKISHGNQELAKDALSDATAKAFEPQNDCKFKSVEKYMGVMRNYVRREVRIKQKYLPKNVESLPDERPIDVAIGEKSILSDESEHMINDFIDYNFPRSSNTYKFYVRIYIEKVVGGYSWKEMQERYPNIKMNVVQARCAEIFKKFRKYLEKKGHKGK